jgi:bis(5'-nucleosyl)-tetraphosphatase (symmetrical)
MANYAIGDIHGCLHEFTALLKLINFSENRDKLWLVGDLVNRGPHSLEVLRFIRSIEKSVIITLGNHDLHLLALQFMPRLHAKFPLLGPIFAAPDCAELLHWLRMQPIMHYDDKLGFAMSHAGIFPHWEIEQASMYAREFESTLRSKKYSDLLFHMYGSKPERWEEKLSGWDRLRFIVNAFTRMRFCSADGKLNLTCKAEIGSEPFGYMPWFKVPNRKNSMIKIIFGHWAALAGKTDEPNIFALDTACVYGGKLTALRLEDEEEFSIPYLHEERS